MAKKKKTTQNKAPEQKKPAFTFTIDNIKALAKQINAEKEAIKE